MSQSKKIFMLGHILIQKSINYNNLKEKKQVETTDKEDNEHKVLHWTQFQANDQNFTKQMCFATVLIKQN